MTLSTGSTNARASSGSRSCSNSVEPLMSANSAVTVLRSPSAAPAGVASWSTRTDGVDATGDCATALLTGAPHWSQNFDAGWIVAPQFEHEPRKGAAHPLQNLAPSRFSVPHFGQIIPTDLHWHRVGARSNLRRRCVGALNRDVPAATTFHRSSPQRPRLPRAAVEVRRSR